MGTNKPNIFYINRSEIEGRLEPIYYLPSIRQKLELMVKNAGITNIGNISEPIKNGSTPNGGQFQDNGINFYRSQDFNLYQIEKKQYITSEFNNYISRSFVRVDDILLAVVGATLGKVGIIKQKEDEGNINQNVARIRIKDNNFLAEFIAIYLDSTIGQMLIKRLATITTQAYLNNELLSKLPVPKLNINLQTCIIDKYYQAYQLKQEKEKEAKRLLDSIDGYLLGELGITLPEIDNSLENRVFVSSFSEVTENRLDPNYNSLKHKLITQSISNSKFNTNPIKKYCKFKSGFAFNSNNYVDLSECILITIKNINSNEIDINNVTFLPDDYYKMYNDFKVVRGDLVIAMTGATIGKVGIYNHDNKALLNQRNGIIKCHSMNQIYLMNLLNTNVYQEIILTNSVGGAQPNISETDITKLIIPIPPIEKQNEIAEYISNIRERAKRLELEAREILEKAKLEVEQIILGE